MATMTRKTGNGRAKPRGRREREWKRHRAEILAAAEGILLEKGYHGASMQDIAERAEFAVGTLYKFFRAKDELYQVLFEEKVKEIAGVFKKALESATEPLGKIERFIEVSTEIAEKYGKFFYIYMSGTVGILTARPIAPLLRTKHKKFEEEVARILEAAMERGHIRRMDARYAAMGLIGLSRGVQAMWVEDERRGIGRDKVTEMVKEMFFGGMLTEEGRRVAGAVRRNDSNSTTGMAAGGGER